MTKRINKAFIARRLLSLFLIVALLGISPGIYDNLAFSIVPVAKAEAKPLGIFDVQTTDDGATSTAMSEEEDEESQQIIRAVEESDEELVPITTEEAKKEMSKIEELAWSIGKAMLPTLAVMALSAALVCPVGWIVAGAVLAGAATSAVVTYAYEKRKNTFREEGSKKPDAEIWKNVSINAAISGVMAPFNMLTGGLVQTVGPLTAKTIAVTAVKAGAINFAGSTVSNVVKGGVTNLWYNHYYNYGEKEKELNERIKRLYENQPLTEEQEKELVACLEELDQITEKKYTLDNFKEDEKAAFASAAITGVLGGMASRFGAETAMAKTLSSKLFGTTSKAGLISNAIVSNPFAFASGAASAQIQKERILKEIEKNRLEQLNYAIGSSAWQYYEDKNEALTNKYKSIKLEEAGKNAMINNASTQVAMVGVSLAKTRLVDLPAERKKKVQEAYEKENEEWTKANDIRQELELKKALRPRPDDYSTKAEYREAVRQYGLEVDRLKDAYDEAKIVATVAQDNPENQAIINDLKVEVADKMEYDRQLQLAKALGKDSYIDFKAKEIAADEEYAHLSPEEVRIKAEEEVTKGYFKASENSFKKIREMERKLATQNTDLFGEIEVDENGKAYVIVRDDLGAVVKKTEFKHGQGASFIDRVSMDSSEDLKNAEINAVVRQVYNASSMVKPSAYRNEYVNMKVNELRGLGLSEKQISSQLDNIVSEANSQTYQNFGSNWQNLAKSELLAAGLERAKYDEGAAPTLDKMFNFVKGTLTNKTVSTIQSGFSTGVKSAIDVTGLAEAPGIFTPYVDSDKRNEEVIKKVYINIDRQYRDPSNYYNDYNRTYNDRYGR